MEKVDIREALKTQKTQAPERILLLLCSYVVLISHMKRKPSDKYLLCWGLLLGLGPRAFVGPDHMFLHVHVFHMNIELR